jgi:hypothetical protein
MEERDRSPEGRFVYLAEKRVEKALKAIQSVGVLSERKNYKYNQVQVDQIFAALDTALESVKAEFDKNLSEPSTFKFKD